MKYWYNVKSALIEDDDTRSSPDDLLGPFGTMDEARNALVKAKENERIANASDAQWDKDEGGA